MQCFSLTALDFTFTTRHIHTWASFKLWFSLFILSGAISPLFSSSILHTYQPGEFIFQYHTFLPFQSSWGSQGKNTEVAYHSLLQEMTISQAMTSRDMLFSHSRSVSIPVPKKGNDKECSNHHTTALISMLAR